MFKSIWKFINYWYFRYLLVTELYMVEKWERAMFHIVFFVIVAMLSLFNTQAVIGFVSIISNRVSNTFYGQGVLPDITKEALRNEL